MVLFCLYIIGLRSTIQTIHKEKPNKIWASSFNRPIISFVTCRSSVRSVFLANRKLKSESQWTRDLGGLEDAIEAGGEEEERLRN